MDGGARGEGIHPPMLVGFILPTLGNNSSNTMKFFSVNYCVLLLWKIKLRIQVHGGNHSYTKAYKNNNCTIIYCIIICALKQKHNAFFLPSYSELITRLESLIS